MGIGKSLLSFGTLLAVAALCGCGSVNSQLAYVTYPSQNGVAAFLMDKNTGAFTQLVGSPFPAGSSPAAIVVAPSGKFAYTSNQSDGTISLLTVDSHGFLNEVMPRTPARVGPKAMVMSPGGNFLFVANTVSNNISAYAVDSSSGALKEVSGSPFATGSSPIGLAISPNGSYVYVSNSNLATVSGYAVGTDGSLQAVAGSPFAAGRLPSGLTVSPSGKFLYVANSQDGTISGFQVNSSTGALTAMPGSPYVVSGTANPAPISVAVDPSEKYVVVALFQQTSVAGFSLDQTTGALSTENGMSATTTGNPVTIGFDPTGKFLMVLTQGTGGSLSDFTISVSGTAVTLPSASGTGSLASAPGSYAVTK